MDSHPMTAVTPFRLLDLPREVRDDIYEAAIFDLSPPDMFWEEGDLKFRKMDTNVLLTSRQVYWEARDVTVHRAQLILVSVKHWDLELGITISRTLSGITGIDPMYRNLCIMSHRIDYPIPSGTQDSCEFILHRHDLEFFCRLMMGDFEYRVGKALARATHTLDLHSSPTYGQHEFSSIDAAQTMVLQQYRQTLRNLKHFVIRGPSIGWETGLYGAALQEIRSIDDREPTDLIDDIRALEQKGSQVFLQTGDVEAADAFWAKAYKKCVVAGYTYGFSCEPEFQDDDLPKAWTTYIQRWTELRCQHGEECAVPYLELKLKLTRLRLSGILRFFEEGHHLATRYGRVPKRKYQYRNFVLYFFGQLKGMGARSAWSPPPADEAQLCLTEAAISRLLNAMPRGDEVDWFLEDRDALVAYRAVRRASELLPNDEAIQQERGRVETWMRSLVDEGKLESIPSFESLTGPHWSWDSKAP